MQVMPLSTSAEHPSYYMITKGVKNEKTVSPDWMKDDRPFLWTNEGRKYPSY